MGSHLRGLLLPAGVALSTDLHAVTLNQGIRLIPLPDDVLDALPAAPTGDVGIEAFTYLTGPLEILQAY